MNQEKETYQQQILFEQEIELESKEADLVEQIEQQVEIDNSLWLQDESESLESENSKNKSRKSHWLIKAAVALLSIIIVVETSLFFIAGFQESPIVAALYAVLFSLLVIISSKVFIKEVRGLVQLKRRQKLQNNYQELVLQGDKSKADEYCRVIEKQLPIDLQNNMMIDWKKDSKSLSAEETLDLFSDQVLTEVDQRAIEKISKYATESVVLIALSPLALVDMLLMFWRNLKMIDEISQLYGLQLGYWGRVKLIKQLFVNMIYAGVSELAVDLGADLLGAELIGKMSGRIGQGVGAGMLTTRLGLSTIKLCRPIAFHKKQPKLSHVRKQILKQVGKLAPKLLKS